MLQQILKFELELFDVRTRKSIKIIDNRDFVRGIQINKDLQLNNQAIVTFNKSKAYKKSDIESHIKLYNYAKIKFVLKNYGNTNIVNVVNKKAETTHTFYFSGFITDVNKNFVLSDKPDATVSLIISDFSSLFKTTFYTKNLVFLDILNQAVPEFRLLNFNDVFNDPNGNFLDQPYSPNQMGFLFFAFFFYKFMYPMVYENVEGKNTPKIDSGNKIFKDFKIFMPFDMDVPGVNSIFATQAQTLILYKQFQGTAYDIFKYLYPEPIFEFNTYETETSVILMIRPTPFMSFKRHFSTDFSRSINISGIAERGGGLDIVEERTNIESSKFNISSYDIIESDENGGDFGFKQIQKLSASPFPATYYISSRIEPVADKIPITVQRPFSSLDLLPKIDESEKMQELFYNINKFNNVFIETMSMRRSSSSVVNIIWTTPVTDTAILQLSGRSIVFAKMQEALKDLRTGTFDEYISKQFEPGNNSNPVFLWNYKNQFPDGFVSGDINYFGIREFEVKWNFMTLYENALSIIMRNMNKNTLKTIRNTCKNKALVDDISSYIQKDSQQIEKKGKVPIKKTGVVFKFGNVESEVWDWKPKSTEEFVKEIVKKPLRSAYVKTPTQTDNKIFVKNALKDPALGHTLTLLGFNAQDIASLTSVSKIVDLLLEAKEKSKDQFGVFADAINGVISRAYRENEHLYDVNFVTVINTSVLPGMILESFNESGFNAPRFKGYVTSVNHVIDFNAASFKTTVSLSRTASDDSGVGA